MVVVEPPAGFTDMLLDMVNEGCGVVIGERFFSKGMRGAEESGEFSLVEGGSLVEVCSSSSEEEDSRI